MAQNLLFIDCQSLAFSPQLSQERMQRAQQLLGADVIQRFLCFALYLLGVNRNAIGRAVDISPETAKSIIKAINADGLCALEDRRRSMSTFLPQSRPQAAAITVQRTDERIVVDFGGEGGRQLSMPGQNVLQIRAVLLSLLNSGLLSNHQVAEAIGLTPSHTATLARRLEQEDISSLIDKRQGQKSEYRVTPQIKAELVQQFVVDTVAHGNVSSEAISAELKERCQITIPARTVRHHLARIGLPAIKRTLPKLLAAGKKNSET
jgi:transposase